MPSAGLYASADSRFVLYVALMSHFYSLTGLVAGLAQKETTLRTSHKFRVPRPPSSSPNFELVRRLTLDLTTLTDSDCPNKIWLGRRVFRLSSFPPRTLPRIFCLLRSRSKFLDQFCL